MSPRLKKKQSKLEQVSLKATTWIGTTQSIVVHSILFLTCFLLPLFGISIDSVLLILTTAVSLEAIYLAIFIQMTVNKNTESLEEVEDDIDEIQKDVDSIEEDMEEISDDIEEIQENDEEDEEFDKKTKKTLSQIQNDLQKLMLDIDSLQKRIGSREQRS